MNFELLKNLDVPKGKVDVVLDTDAYNEIDDQYAIAYLLNSEDKLNVKAIYAAPFFNENSKSPKDGMERSYDEILPWDFIDIGVNRDYLVRENEKAKNEELTQNCRKGCTGCGVNVNFKDGECFEGAILN